jgi:hypothetical protein
LPILPRCDFRSSPSPPPKEVEAVIEKFDYLLFISEETVKLHVKHIMEKLGANDRTEAVTIAVRRGIIQL